MAQSQRSARALLSAAALAALCGLSVIPATSARAAAPAIESPLYLQADDVQAQRRPGMQFLEDSGAAGPLDDAGIRFYGHIEGSWTHNFDDPGSDINVGRLFDIEHDDPTLNQISLNLEKTVRPSADAWEFGFRVEVIYGGDARFTHSNGLLDNHEDDGGIIPGPDEQWDVLNAYVDVNAPWANGMRFRLGKFTYFKVIDPVASPLYSRSYSFGAALPFTLTGAMGTYALSDNSSVDFGISRGWDQSLEDNNSAIDVFGGYRTTVGDNTGLAIKAITGPELPDNDGAYRTAVDVTVSQQMNDKLTLIGNGIFGHQADGGDVAGSFEDAFWYGVAGYAIYDISEHLQFNGRLEWYRDEDGATVTGGESANLYSATAGLTITPFPGDKLLSGLKIRPEVRYDYASEDVFDLDDTTGVGTSDNQFTAALEAYFAF